MCLLKDLHLGILRKIVSLTDMLISWNEGDEDIFEILDAIIEEQETLIEEFKRQSSETQRTTEYDFSEKSYSNQEMDGIIELLKSLVNEKDLENNSLRADIKRKNEDLKLSENKSFYRIIDQLLNSKQNTGTCNTIKYNTFLKLCFNRLSLKAGLSIQGVFPLIQINPRISKNYLIRFV